MTIKARYAGTCSACGQAVAVGQDIEWERRSKIVRHADCSTASQPVQLPQASSLTVEVVGPRAYVRGNSYPFRDAIRSVGGHWDAEQKAWWVGATKADELRAALASATPAAPEPFRHTKCKQCGARPDRRGWPRIYKSGICSDCYRDERDEAEMGW